MSTYQVLARKYRPKTFADVAGQEVLTRVLQGAIRDERVGHAYLFAGPRGTGKTTTARVLAKALLCERGPAEEPCGECQACRDVDAGSHVDVIEIDAASNTGVEDVRVLREQVAYAPMRGRYKVYIVDEVHMLSKSAFNAFLKTLEEPPPHVVFLFATTEPHKVLDTVLSRCQVLHLSLIPEEVIAARIAAVFEAEGVRCEEGVPAEIGRIARGSLRDALSFCDQLLALVGSEPTVADVRRVGGDGESRVEDLLDLAAAGDRAGVLGALPVEEGGEARLLDGCLESLRASLLDAVRGGAAAAASTTPAELRARRLDRAKRLGPERLRAWLEELILARERLAPRNLPQHARLVLELALLELCRPELGLPLAELADRLEALEARLGGAPAGGGGKPAPRRPAPPDPSPPASATAARERPARPAPPPEPASDAGGGSGDEPEVPADDPALRADDELQPAPPPSGDAPGKPPEKTRERRAPRGGKGPARRAPARGAAGLWKAFLGELGDARPSLAALLERKGKLLDHGPERARIQVARTTARERPLLEDAANVRACEAAIERAGGGAVRVEIEDTSRQRPGDRDPFTSEVVDLFGGHIEDNA